MTVYFTLLNRVCFRSGQYKDFVAEWNYAVFRWQYHKTTLDAAVGHSVSLLPIINSTLQLIVWPFLRVQKAHNFHLVYSGSYKLYIIIYFFPASSPLFF